MVLKVVVFGMLVTLAINTSAAKVNKEIEQELSRTAGPVEQPETTEGEENEITEVLNETETSQIEPEKNKNVAVTTNGGVHVITERACAIRIKGFGQLLNRFTIKCGQTKKCRKFCKKHYGHATGKCMRLKTRIGFVSRAYFTEKSRKVCGCRRRRF